MVIDTEHVISAVTRELSCRQHGGSPARVIGRTFATVRKELWKLSPTRSASAAGF